MTVYRKKSKQYNIEDARTPFSKVTVNNNSNQFKKVSLKQKLAIAFAFEGSRNYITSLYPLVFPVPKTKTKSKPNKPAAYTPFGKLITAKIEYDPSKLETVNNLNAYNFFAVYQNELQYLKQIK